MYKEVVTDYAKENMNIQRKHRHSLVQFSISWVLTLEEGALPIMRKETCTTRFEATNSSWMSSMYTADLGEEASRI